MAKRKKLPKSERIPEHVSGKLHLTGSSRFIGDDLKPAGLQYVKILFSQHPHARIKLLDFSRAQKVPGVSAVLTHQHIPGENQIGLVLLDEPLLPVDEVQYRGQPLALVVAETAATAEYALSEIDVEYETLDPVLTIEDALRKGMDYVPERHIRRGDVEAGFQRSDLLIEGTFSTGAQEHLYLETQRCIAVPGEDEYITLYSATQSTSEVQAIAARVLGVNSKDITVDVPRLGGAFGGKERSATLWACLAALACQHVGKPVELKLTRSEDMLFTGKRHPFEAKYKVGFNRDGKIQAYKIELNSNGGAYVDLSIAILERALLHADNCYSLPNVSITGRALRTNLPPNTAFRGFGAPQSIMVMEHVIERIAHKLKVDPLQLRKINSYQPGDLTPYGQEISETSTDELLERLAKKAKYQDLRRETDEFNLIHDFPKRGLAVIPVKFGISFTTAFMNQGSALLWVYADGTISLSHGGVEMGQEVNTKVAQIVSKELGVSMDRIRCESANTKRVGNASPTAASSASDINGYAANNAALQIKERLNRIAVDLLKEQYQLDVNEGEIRFADDQVFSKTHPAGRLSFSDVVKRAHLSRVPLGAHGFYKTPGVHFDREAGRGNPFYYFVYGCALVQVEVDILYGNSKLLKVFIVHETGRSLNPEIDRGQIIGGFMQGMGWSTFEEVFQDDQGRYLAAGPSTYKIPTIRDLPHLFDIEMVERDCRQSSVFHSKGIGEPPFMYGEAVYFAIKDAVESLADHNTEVELGMPATPEAVVHAISQILKNNIFSQKASKETLK
ncbi:xanthine dehydrogenase molybdopterin binding subunit [candidate division LCP-89 bacterium B3_LCP]|uniref:Xanthine dehydrogenase molybdopterin binding subunit n=1 Tax=candidate division LCP-89 bacterium B3_LCP TaxID=2012998 RepID=A0A532URV5_UNCL8|nr:MAG: xanthine dehydrogenase molybdopterin binding subunit [candidate division LCP-89 bacterium B3_LCP]